MNLKEKYSFEYLINLTEDIVIEELGNQLDELQSSEKKVCMCNDCVLDYTALALNHLKHHYQVSLLGSMYNKKITEKEKEEIKKQVKIAIEKISQNPSHE